jgi:hypothetical protein
MYSGFGWDWYKKAQTWFVGLVKVLGLPAEPGAYCPSRLYSQLFHSFGQGPDWAAMFGLFQPRRRVTDSVQIPVLAPPANISRRSRLPLLFVPDFHIGYWMAEIGIASI